MNTSRRDFIKTATLAGIATMAAPPLIRRAFAAPPIKIGVPTVLSGGNVQYGTEVKRGCELFAADVKARGGVLGRPVEFLFEDTASDPATAVRKAQKLVEKDGVKFLTGVVLSSEALAISAKCPEWGAIFMSTVNGTGALTAKSFNRYFFRQNISGPMGTRAVNLYLAESPMKRFFGLGSDYAWGRDSIGAFSRGVQAMGKQMAGTDFPPVGTKDFASYIAKIKEAKPDACYLVLVGQDATIFFKQAAQFGLTKDVRMMMEILEMETMKAVGDAMTGAIGGSRYPFTLDNPKNRDFVKRFYAMHHVYPDMFDGDMYEGLEWLTQVMQKAGTADDVDKIITAWEGSTYDGLSGKFVMRTCDHQAEQPGFVVEAVKDPKYPHLVPKVIGTYPADKITPKCRSEEFA